jgi:hypothetical protein
LVKIWEINCLDIKVRRKIIKRVMKGRVRLELIARRFWVFITVSGILFACLTPSQGKAKNLLLGFKQGKNSDSVPEGWELITYFRTLKNDMSLAKEGTRTVLRVKSLGGASAILKRPDVDLKAFPVLVWRWKINRVVGMAIEGREDRNDSAARIRVIFGKAAKPSLKPIGISKFFKSLGLQMGGTEPSGLKIDYIWGSTTPKGEVIDYPGSRNHKIVIVESGNKRANRWVWEKRNLVEDFREFFGGTPPGLAGVVVLTDTDQTNEGVIACYSSIILMSK